MPQPIQGRFIFKDRSFIFSMEKVIDEKKQYLATRLKNLMFFEKTRD
jgi:hypothetical protein